MIFLKENIMKLRRDHLFFLWVGVCAVAAFAPACGSDDNGDGSLPSEVRVNGTGDPAVDIANIKAALLDVNAGETIRLIGRFEMTTCIGCIVIEKPVTLQGSDCSPSGRRSYA